MFEALHTISYIQWKRDEGCHLALVNSLMVVNNLFRSMKPNYTKMFQHLDGHFESGLVKNTCLSKRFRPAGPKLCVVLEIYSLSRI